MTEKGNILQIDLSDQEKSREWKSRNLELAYRELHQKRKAYLEERDLQKASLSGEEIQKLIECLNFYREYEYPIQSLLVEMLKYPIPEVSIAAEKCIDDNMIGEEISLSLWLNILHRQFIPNNAIRLLFKHQKVLLKNCAQIVFPRELKKHILREEKRLIEAEAVKNDSYREKQVKRVKSRLMSLRRLLEIYQG